MTYLTDPARAFMEDVSGVRRSYQRTLYLYALLAEDWDTRATGYNDPQGSVSVSLKLHRLSPVDGTSIWSVSVPMSHPVIDVFTNVDQSIAVAADGSCVVGIVDGDEVYSNGVDYGFRRYAAQDGALVESVKLTAARPVYTTMEWSRLASVAVHDATEAVAVEDGVIVGGAARPYSGSQLPRLTGARIDFSGDGTLWTVITNPSYIRADGTVGGISAASLFGGGVFYDTLEGVWANQGSIVHFGMGYAGGTVSFGAEASGAIDQTTLAVTKAPVPDVGAPNLYARATDGCSVMTRGTDRTYSAYYNDGALPFEWWRYLARSGTSSGECLHEFYVPVAAEAMTLVCCRIRTDYKGESDLDALAATRPGIYRHDDANVFLTNNIADPAAGEVWTRTLGSPPSDAVVSVAARWL